MCPKYSPNLFECECEFCVEKKIQRCPNSDLNCLCYCGSCERLNERKERNDKTPESLSKRHGV